jgi:uncharacterized phiE125 gp8 family phage protein
VSLTTVATPALPWHDGIEWRTATTATDDNFLAITVDFAKSALNIVRTDQDDLIEHYIKAATLMGERLSGQHISPKTMTLTLSGFPTGAIEFADGPVRQIASVTYLDDDDVEQTYDTASPHDWVFEPGGRHRKARLTPVPGGSWPTAATRNDALTVTFYVGYEYAEDVPADLKQAIVVTVGELYKSPDLSNADGLEPNVLSVAHFWPRRWSNAF